MGIRPGKAKGPSVAPASGGGGGGNVSGAFTAPHIPYATALHSLADTPMLYNSGGAGSFSWGAANYSLSTTAFAYGALNLTQAGAMVLAAGSSIALDVNKFTVSATGDLSLGAAGTFTIATNKFTVSATGVVHAEGNVTVGANVTLTPAGAITLGTGGSITLDTNKFTVSAAGAVHAAGDVTVGAGITLQATSGEIDSIFLHVTSDSAMDGFLHLGGNFAVNTNKFTIDAATGNTGIGGTLDVKGILTYEASTVKKIVTPVPAGGGPWTVAINVALADFFFVGSGGGGTNTVVSNPTNVTVTPGFIQTVTVRIESSANAADTFTFGTAYHFAGGAPVVDWSVPGYYYYGFIYNENAVEWDCVSFVGPIT